MSGGPVLNRDGKLIAIHGISDKEGALKGGIPINLFSSTLENILATRRIPDASNPANPTPISDHQRAERFFNLGLRKQYQNDHQGAIADYTEAIRLQPKYAAAYNNRGFARMSSGDYQRAMADYNQAIKLRQDMAQAYFNRGQTLVLMGRRQEALVEFRTAARYVQHKGMRYLYHRSRERIRDLSR